MDAQIPIDQILFLDIETVPEVAAFDQYSEEKQALWEKKSANFRNEQQSAADVFGRAGIYAEFGKIICISVGMTYKKGTTNFVRIKSFYGDNEASLLSEFSVLLKKFPPGKIHLCAHNGKDFDFPYIARRMLIQGLALPEILNVAGKKPWEVPFLDTMELWKFGDYRHFTSLELLANVFQLPTPKSKMDGSMVADAYWQDQNLKEVVQYCETDVITVLQLYQKFQGEPIIPEERIEFTTIRN